jgi:hypothetical protein
MKIRLIIPVFIVLLCIPLSSCEKIKELADVSFETTIPLSFVINETAVNNSGKTYTESKLLNAASDPEIAKYASKIKEIKVSKITYTISNANPNTVTFTNGTIKIVATSKQIASVASINLTSTTETDLITDTSGLNELAAKLLDDKQEMVQLQGNLSKTPVTFNLTFKFYAKVTANPL